MRHQIKLLLISICFCSSMCAASNNSRMIKINFDSSVHYKNGESIFYGNVQVTQQDQQIFSDKLVVKKNAAKKIEEIIAYGERRLVHYTAKIENTTSLLTADAKIIHYYPMNKKLILKENVTVNQGGKHFEGDLLIYNMKEESILMPKSKNSRSTIIYDSGKETT